MPLTIARLRTWFAVTAIALVLTVSGVYLVRRYQMRVLQRIAEKKLGVEIQQSTEGFSLSKSEGGHTLFKISAKKATQYKDTGKASLQDVNIVVYGRDSSRFDQIYGANFEYDAKTGNVIARGEVDIDLEANTQGRARPDQATPSELKNPIHLKTSGLVFNQKTGLAQTDQQIELHVPEANGTARGVLYDSHTNRMTLNSDIHITTLGPISRTLVARHAVISKDPRQAVLDSVTVTEPQSKVVSDRVTVLFREDNNIDRIYADGHIAATNTGANSYEVRGAKGDLQFGGTNDLQVATLSDGTQFHSSGERPMHGTAGRIVVHFGPETQPRTLRLSEDAHVIQDPAPSAPPRNQQRTEIVADILDMDLRDGKLPSKATTSGAAHINVDQPANGNQPATTTVVNAGRFVADFNREGRIQRILGEPNARITSTSAGQPEKVSTSDKLEVTYTPQGVLADVVQQGNFRYHEKLVKDGDRIATADTAHYSPSDNMLHLTGSPRIVEGGMSMTANVVHINRHTGEAVAEGNVKSTYSDMKAQPNGAMLASSDPIHVTAKKMTAEQNTGIALYTGGSRLWQGANIVEAPIIEFNRDNRSLVAEDRSHSAAAPVTSVFVQKGKDGKLTPVNINARKLTYVDAERRARYEGGVTAHTAEGVLTADHVDIYLKESGTAATSPQPAPSQLDRIVAQGNVIMAQPGRRGSGDRLTYYQDDGRFVLTGGSPMISDAEHGTVRGATLTFFSKDDRVLVEGSNAAPTVTHTRVSK
jgi:lipopolysaccharide export system protein LptA